MMTMTATKFVIDIYVIVQQEQQIDHSCSQFAHLMWTVPYHTSRFSFLQMEETIINRNAST